MAFYFLCFLSSSSFFPFTSVTCSLSVLDFSVFCFCFCFVSTPWRAGLSSYYLERLDWLGCLSCYDYGYRRAVVQITSQDSA